MTIGNLELPRVVSREKWLAARKQQSGKEKELTRPAGLGRWFISGLLLMVLPKCLACVAGYVALAAGLGLAGPELCGGATEDAGAWTGGATLLLLPGLVVAAWLAC